MGRGGWDVRLGEYDGMDEWLYIIEPRNDELFGR